MLDYKNIYEVKYADINDDLIVAKDYREAINIIRKLRAVSDDVNCIFDTNVESITRISKNVIIDTDVHK